MGESGRKEELQRGTGNFWGDDVFTILPVVMASQGHTYVKTYQVVHFQIWAVYCMLVIRNLRGCVFCMELCDYYVNYTSINLT